MRTHMNYMDASSWVIRETAFNEDLLGKTEAIMCLGNGYLGLRSASEENYLNIYRNCFVAGTYNKADRTEVSELPNAADCIEMEIYLDGERFALNQGRVLLYQKSLNLKTGELRRDVVWKSPNGYSYALKFLRFVSLSNLHVIGQRVCIKSLDKDSVVRIRTGINGRMSNSGAQHFEETEKRFYENRYMQYVQTTVESNILFVWNSAVIGLENPQIHMSRRKVFCEYEFKIKKEVEIQFDKISNVYTTRDTSCESAGKSALQTISLSNLKKQIALGYEKLFEASKKEWSKYWAKVDIKISSSRTYDQLALRFAQYHLRIMTPVHDARMSIGAKGLSGEGYKGHVFWDTEMFILPYYTLQMPDVAKKLLQYRAYGLDGAKRKAKLGGYEGAQYPWEAAWIEDGEVTPETGDVDVVSGTAQVIWTGKIEQHITADIIYGLWQYYQITQDEAFMKQFGYEMIFETANFWASRLEIGADGKGHIDNVIGPDEYKEHVNDNAYTNYMAYWNLERAVECYERCKNPHFKRHYQQWKWALEKIYLPIPREDSVIPQDATYLTLKEIDLTKYKKQDFVLGIYRDYNAQQLNLIQVSKQADILILFYLLENYFTQEIKIANWNYYEPKTLHDSSLSLSTHCILANDLEQKEMAYELFEKLCQIDMGQNMKSSDAGIHAASLGGLWQSIVFGFAGIRILDGKLRIRPHLPETWEEIQIPFVWAGTPCKLSLTRKQILLEKLVEDGLQILIEICGHSYLWEDKLIVNYSA